MQAAVVKFPDRVVRGWAWFGVAFLLLLGSSILLWIASGHVLTTKAGRPIPNWLAVVTGLMCLAGAVGMVYQRVRAELAAHDWIQHSKGVPYTMRLPEAASVIARALRMDGVRVGRFTFARVKREAQRVQQHLPNLWIDQDIIPHLRASRTSKFVRYPAYAPHAQWSGGLVFLGGILALIFTMPLLGGWISGMLPRNLLFELLFLSPLLLWIPLFVAHLTRKRGELVILDDRVLFVRGRREHLLTDDDCLVIATAMRRGRYGAVQPPSGYDEEHPSEVRWWILTESLGTVFVDGVPLRGTPWTEIILPALGDLPFSSRCRVCGYALHGISGTQCPECGLEAI